MRTDGGLYLANQKLSMRRKTRKRSLSLDPALVPERETILEFLDNVNKPRSLKRIARELGVSSDAAILALERRLDAMQRDGQLIKNRKQGYGLVQKMDLLQGRVIGHPDGYGFLRLENGGEDLYMSARDMRRLLHGDKILARIIGVDKRGRREGTVVEILERANNQVVGRFFKEGTIGFVVPDNRRIHQDILITKQKGQKVKSGQYVVAKITQQPDQHTQPLGEIMEVLGTHMSADLAMDITLKSHEIPYKWPDAVKRDASHYTENQKIITDENREDITQLPLITIDGEDARDFDDAVFAEPTKNGWRLLVAIADVSHYVKPESALDQEAQQRGTSVYFPQRVIPMLPEVLSNGLCSLKPDVDRLCMVCELSINRNGKVKHFRFFEGVMQSVARMTYNDVYTIMKKSDPDVLEQYKNIVSHINNLEKLYRLMHSERESHAVIEFGSSETSFQFDKKGKVIGINSRERNDAHRLIEEFMLAANVAAAEYLLDNEIPALYRVHETPKVEKLADLRSFLAEMSLTLEGEDEPATRDYAKLLEKTRKRPDRHLIETVMLRSMPLAMYSSENTGHFGLGFKAYTHFTSPIRRYPDLLVHRAIRHLIQNSTAEGFHYSSAAMPALGNHCSMTERRADEASREIVQWYKCQFMQEKVGENFNGTISSVTSFGVFVELDDIFVEGLVHITSLPIDYYHFDPIGHRLRGERTGREFRLTNRVRVKVMRVDVEDKKIDFEIVEDEK